MSVINQAQAQTRAEEIRTETVANANTAQRVGSLFKDIVDSLKWVAFSAGVAGLVPAPDSGGGDAAKFLRGDGVWAAVSATFSPSNPGDDGKLAYASGGAAAFAANIKTNGTYLQFGTTAATSGTLRFGNDVFLVGIKAVGGADVGLLGIGADDATYTGDLNTTAHYIRSGGSVVIRSDGDN
ncbi:MAG TPA: hypothetical protein VGK73_05655, partial [Polyangiaceae bacterium]